MWYAGYFRRCKSFSFMRHFFVLSIGFFVLAAGCGPIDRTAAEREKIQKEMDQREVKKVRPSEIIDKAREKGRQITDEAQRALLLTLTKQIQAQGVVGAVEYCNLKALPIMDSLSQAHKATIRRVSNRWRNPADAPNAQELPIIEAYEFAAEQGQELREEVFLEDSTEQLIYTRPISIGAGLCLQCHGTAGKELSPEAASKLRELYPEDKATGYELGEWRGIWKVTFEKRDIVLEL